METNIPAVGKKFRVISGHYIGFEGICVSYDLESDLPIIIQDENWNTRAVRINEVEGIDGGKTDISRDQQN